MNYLLDTSVLLWFLADHNRLTNINKSRIRNPENNIHISLVSMWEMAIKFNLGKLDSPLSFAEVVDEVTGNNSFRMLDIRIAHLWRVAELPLLHRDPFDRLLIAQSQVEGLPIITSDSAFDRYQVQRIW